MSERTVQPERSSPAVVTVLMYHALAEGDGAGHFDPHYAVSDPAFAAHLDLFDRLGHRPASVERLLDAEHHGGLALTFDDGNASDMRAAAMIAERGGTADFFVNPSSVGGTGHLGWSELRAMSELGMSIQSHGLTHRHLDTLSPHEVRAELADSKRSIEDRIGRHVVLFAPPGGRMRADLPDVARALGYRAVCSSRVDAWRRSDGPDIPRMPVLRSTSMTRLQRWVEQESAELAVARMRYATLTAAKRLLPRSMYETARGALIRAIGRGTHG